MNPPDRKRDDRDVQADSAPGEFGKRKNDGRQSVAAEIWPQHPAALTGYSPSGDALGRGRSGYPGTAAAAGTACLWKTALRDCAAGRNPAGRLVLSAVHRCGAGIRKPDFCLLLRSAV